MSLTNGDVEDPHQQALLVHEVFQTSSLQQGDTWYVLSMRWWDLWKDYTLFDCKADLPSQPHHLSRSCSGTTKGEKPPNIDNSDLIIRPGCPQLQSNLVENRDFILLNKEVWKLLYSWYPGGPILRRRVIGEGQNMRVELYPFCLTVYKVDDFGMPIIDSKLQSPFSRSDTLEEVRSHLRANLGLKYTEEVHLWHRPSLEVDQTLIDSLEGWEMLEGDDPLEDYQVVDGSSILLETRSSRSLPSRDLVDDRQAWPFFHRLRKDFKQKTYKDPQDPNVILEVDDKIDAAAKEEGRRSSVSSECKWYAATVVQVEGSRLLVQFHNRPKPKGAQLESTDLVLEGLTPELIEVGMQYESLDSRGCWHQVRITRRNLDPPDTYEAQLLDENTTWPVVQPGNIRELCALTEEAKKAFKKVFARYANNDIIEGGGLRGLMSCATNEYIPEDSPKVAQLLKEPFGTEAGVKLDGFLEYWRQQIAASGNKLNYWLQQELLRLFQRAGVEMGNEEDQLLAQGREWIERDSTRLAQYRTNTIPSYQDIRDFRDFRIYDKLDCRFGREWKQAEVMEVDWEEMTILVQSRDVNSVASPTTKAQRQWIPMESDRLAEYETKSLESPEHEGDPGPLLARSVSRGGVCPQPGACGLQNLGNTCFINSTLQCLSNSMELRTFFAGTSGEAPLYLDQISASPLSTQGRIAREFSKLLRDMWSNENKSVAPATLKKLIGQKRPEFAGYQQHDAQELLCYLLDALHEDVNRASYPYPTEEEDEKTKSDEVKAREMWAKHTRRSDSTIVDLFQFQIRSELTCPVCSRVSVTFDPIMYLTLPVPKPPHSVPLTVLLSDFPRSPPRTMELEVEKSATIEELESALWRALQRTPAEVPSCFCFADVYYGRIYRQFDPQNLVSDFRQNDNIVAFEVPLCPGVRLQDHVFIPLVCRKKQKPTQFSSQTWQYEKFEPPRIVAVPRDASNGEVFKQLKDMAEYLLESCQIEQPWNFEILTNVDNYATKAGDLLLEDHGLFLAPQQLAIDFDEHAEQLKELLPKATKRSQAGPGTTLSACLAKSMEREVLSEMDSVYCKKCKEHRCQTKKLDLWSLPVCLIVHLKRFGRERLDGPLVKIGCSVDFPNELDLEEYMCQKGARSASSTRYELYGVINHHGNVGGGHYTANAVVVPPSAKTLELGEWFNFNDSIVSRATPEDLDTQAAYVLFYRRID